MKTKNKTVGETTKQALSCRDNFATEIEEVEKLNERYRSQIDFLENEIFKNNLKMKEAQN
jgi:hypothetical protein